MAGSQRPNGDENPTPLPHRRLTLADFHKVRTLGTGMDAMGPSLTRFCLRPALC